MTRQGPVPVLLTAAVLAATALLSACDANRNLRAALRAELGAPQQVDRIPLPYAQMRVTVNDGSAGRMVLGRVEDGVEQWLAANGFTLWLHDGRIVATSGLRDDLQHTRALDGAPPLADFLRSGAARSETRVLYAEVPGAPLGLIAEAWLERVKVPAPVAVHERVMFLQQVVEHVRVPSSGEQWKNEYWMRESDGEVYVTRQKLPGVPYVIRLERLLE